MAIFYSEITELVVDAAKKYVEDKELCEAASIVIMMIVLSSDTVGDMKASFIDYGSFALFLKLLEKYRANKVICRNFSKSTNFFLGVLENYFMVVKELNEEFSDIKTALNVFVEEGGIKAVSEVLKEHRHDQIIFSKCISTLCKLSMNESKQAFHRHRYSFCLSHLLQSLQSLTLKVKPSRKFMLVLVYWLIVLGYAEKKTSLLIASKDFTLKLFLIIHYALWVTKDTESLKSMKRP